ncbi:calpain-A-like [Erpetoichthys calabaricus]|uniref:calpain-A-like n=1 Tax=Erpetoichthys calabaricus TaxID=27687 RepID=UPI0022344B9C|nr:calpain-A-like [Erpetoichthys calabaricus]
MYRIADYVNHREHLYEQLATASRKRALITCGTSQQTEAGGQHDGLVAGHAYGVTAVKKLTTPRGRIPLVRILNPWGSGQAMEWTGDWGDSSPLWDEIPVWTREAFGFTKKDDGEFWMKFDDFCEHFDNVTVLTLGPDFNCNGISESGSLQEVKGRWLPGFNAGGSRNNLVMYATNPQHPITIQDSDVSPDEKGDDEDGRCSVLICLLQSFNRRDRKLGLKMNPIGLQIYRTNEPESTLTIDMLAKQVEEADSGPYVAQRSINLRCQLTVGSYVIIPSTFSPGATGSYMLRIFTEEPVLVHEALNFCSCDI